MKTYAIILASGQSVRFGGNTPKQFMKIGDTTILEKSIKAFEVNSQITNIILVCNPQYIDLVKKTLKNKFKKLSAIIPGGETRQKSSQIGVSFIAEENAKILIHDAARPFVSQNIINNCIKALDTHKACTIAIPSTDTIIKIDKNNYIKEIPKRDLLKRVQTPQCFISNIIKKAHHQAMLNNNIMATDDCSLVLQYKLAPIYVLEGEEENIKITHKKDLENNIQI